MFPDPHPDQAAAAIPALYERHAARWEADRGTLLHEPVGAVDAPALRLVTAETDPLEVAALAHSNIDAERAADPLFADDRWEPTPVPPPTYTMKAKASRPLPEPLEVPVPIEVDDDDIAWDETRHQPRVGA